MDSKHLGFLTRLFLCGGLIALSAACSQGPDIDHASDYNIGNPLQSISSMTTQDGGEAQQVVLFDKLLRRIHQFDLGSMQALRSFAVRNPEQDHYVLNGKNGNYLIDLSLQTLTIYNQYNQANYQPFPTKMQGKPKGAYFDPNSGVFVVYDDLQTVGMMTLDPHGEVLKADTFGATVVPGSTATIAAGDVDSSGDLILSMTDNSIVVVDIMKTLSGVGVNANGWNVKKVFTVPLSDILWLAPLPLSAPGADQLILARSNDKISVINTNTGTVDSSYTIASGRVEKLSKYADPHAVVRNDRQATIVFARDGVIETKTFIVTPGPNQIYSVLSSTLSLAKDSWSFVDTTTSVRGIFNDLEETHDSRHFKRYALTRGIATHNVAIDNEPQIEISSTFIFALFKDELGYAERINVSTEEKKTVQRFNLHYIPAN
jgi:hypothetical protein